MRALVFVLAAAVAVRGVWNASIKEPPYCMSDDEEPYVRFATKSPYDFARGSVQPGQAVPEGCQPVQMWHFLRHGTRYPSATDILQYLTDLPRLQHLALQAHQDGQGELCEGDFSLLRDWSTGGLNVTWSYVLTPEGELEHQDIGFRYKAAFPVLLGHPFDNSTYKFRHTATQRTEASARAYARGLFGPEGGSIPMPEPIEHDPLLRFYTLCDKYNSEVDGNPEASVEVQLFQDGPEMEEVLKSVSTRLGFDITFDEAEIMYDYCRFFKAWDPPVSSPWCVAFTPHDLQVMEYWEDLQYYYEDGFGHDINYQMACPPLQDLITYFRNAVENPDLTNPKGIFYFTHSSALLTVMARLGLYHDDVPLTHNTFENERKWHTSTHGTFATNLAFVLSSCDNDNGWWVNMMMSENPTQLPGCPSSLGCSWEEFLSLYGQYEQCDFDSICENNEAAVYSTDGWTFGFSGFLVALNWIKHFIFA